MTLSRSIGNTVMANDDEEVIIILGVVCVALFGTLLLQAHDIFGQLTRREKLWNLVSAMQARKGWVNLFEWKQVFSDTGKEIRTDQAIIVLSNIRYKEDQPPSRYSDDLSDKQSKYTRDYEKKMQLRENKKERDMVEQVIREKKGWHRAPQSATERIISRG